MNAADTLEALGAARVERTARNLGDPTECACERNGKGEGITFRLAQVGSRRGS
jgi:hypothetical protein